MIGKATGSKLAVSGLLATVLVAGVVHTDGTEAAWREATLDALKLGDFLNKLEQKGFTVQEGPVSFPPILEMCCQCDLPSCCANNASSTYGPVALAPAHRARIPL